ncbi:MAG: acyltransferase [Candidatus Omnitrophota bacterium]
MAYYDETQLKALGFKRLGKNVKISTHASIYNAEMIEVGDHSRVDDFCLLSGKITIGKFVHVAPYCNMAGGEKGIVMEDFSGLAYGVQVFTQSDDYSGKTLTNPTVPDRFKNETKKEILIRRHSIVGTGSVILPGVTLEEGTSVGAMSLVRKSTQAWGIYMGNPAKRIMERHRDLLALEEEFLKGPAC